MRTRTKNLLRAGAFLLVLLMGAAAFLAILDRLNAGSDELHDALHRAQFLERKLAHAHERHDRARTRLRTLRDEIHRTRRQLKGTQSCRRPNADSYPHLTAIPKRGPVGTVIHLVGDCFLGRFGTKQGGELFLIRDFQDGCEIYAARGARAEIRNGRFEGRLIVPRRGACFQSTRSHAVRPGRYGINFDCHACTMTHFTVTSRRA